MALQTAQCLVQVKVDGLGYYGGAAAQVPEGMVGKCVNNFGTVLGGGRRIKEEQRSPEQRNRGPQKLYQPRQHQPSCGDLALTTVAAAAFGAAAISGVLTIDCSVGSTIDCRPSTAVWGGKDLRH